MASVILYTYGNGTVDNTIIVVECTFISLRDISAIVLCDFHVGGLLPVGVCIHVCDFCWQRTKNENDGSI